MSDQEQQSEDLSGPLRPETSLSPDLQALEAELASLRPWAPGLDRDRLMFLAGQASLAGKGRSRGTLGRAIGQLAAMAAVALVSAGLTISLARPAPRIVERVVYRHEQPTTVATPVPRKDLASEPASADVAWPSPLFPRYIDAPYLDQLHRLVAQEANDAEPAMAEPAEIGPVRVETTEEPQRARPPVLSRRSLHHLIDELGQSRPHASQSTPSTLQQGAES